MSKVQGGMKCVKYLLFVFNFIFWVSLTVCMDNNVIAVFEQTARVYFLSICLACLIEMLIKLCLHVENPP